MVDFGVIRNANVKDSSDDFFELYELQFIVWWVCQLETKVYGDRF